MTLELLEWLKKQRSAAVDESLKYLFPGSRGGMSPEKFDQLVGRRDAFVEVIDKMAQLEREKEEKK